MVDVANHTCGPGKQDSPDEEQKEPGLLTVFVLGESCGEGDVVALWALWHT